MSIRPVYFCKKHNDYVRPIALISDSGIAHVETMNCEHLALQNCLEYGRVCRPLKNAQRDARHHNRHMQPSAPTSDKYALHYVRGPANNAYVWG